MHCLDHEMHKCTEERRANRRARDGSASSKTSAVRYSRIAEV